MSLADLYQEFFEDSQEKTASIEDPKTPEASTEDTQEEIVEEETVEENDEAIEKLASSYVELGREMARKDFAAFEKQAAAELEEAGVEIPFDATDLKAQILNEMQNNPEYAQELIAKHS